MIIIGTGAAHPITGEPYFPSFGKHYGEWGYFWADELGSVESKIKSFSFTDWVDWLKGQPWEDFFHDTIRVSSMDEVRRWLLYSGNREAKYQFEEIMGAYFES